MKSFLKKRILPYSDSEEASYHEPQKPENIEEIKEELKTLVKKKYIGTPYERLRLFYLTYQKGHPLDAVKAFEGIDNEENAQHAYEDAIKLYHYLGEKEKVVKTIEKFATSRLWHVASATQVRPMAFFNEPVMVEYLLNPEFLFKIREASEIDNGTLVRK